MSRVFLCWCAIALLGHIADARRIFPRKRPGEESEKSPPGFGLRFENSVPGLLIWAEWQRDPVFGQSFPKQWCPAEIESGTQDEACVRFTSSLRIISCPLAGSRMCKPWVAVRGQPEDEDREPNHQDAICSFRVSGAMARTGAWAKWCKCRRGSVVTGGGRCPSEDKAVRFFAPERYRGCRCSDIADTPGLRWGILWQNATTTLQNATDKIASSLPGSWQNATVDLGFGWRNATSTLELDQPSTCTPHDRDPWGSGRNVPCCQGLEKVLKNWEGFDYHYRCVRPRQKARCTPENEDPWRTGEDVPCCNGLERSLKGWNKLAMSYKCIPSKRNAPWAPSPAMPTTGNAAEVAKHMNDLWFGFNENDDSSPLGLYMTMATSFDLFCGGSCYKGFADCRLSVSVYNHKVMVREKTGSIKLTMNRVAGIALNTQRVEAEWRKCSYMWDGAAFNRYNNACGCAAVKNDCAHPRSAFRNKCVDGKTIGPAHNEVKKCTCDRRMVTSSKAGQCVWKGTAFDSNVLDAGADQTRDMLKMRLKHQDKVEGPHHNKEYWNEVIVDLTSWKKTLKTQPDEIVMAFVYQKGHTAGVRIARRMRDKFVDTYKPKTTPPLVAVDVWADPKKTRQIFLPG